MNIPERKELFLGYLFVPTSSSLLSTKKAPTNVTPVGFYIVLHDGCSSGTQSLESSQDLSSISFLGLIPNSYIPLHWSTFLNILLILLLFSNEKISSFISCFVVDLFPLLVRVLTPVSIIDKSL